jgi:hypothetical protein
MNNEFDFIPIKKTFGPKEIQEVNGLSVRSTLLRTSQTLLEKSGIKIPFDKDHVGVGMSIDTKKKAILLYPDPAGFIFRKNRKKTTGYTCNTPTAIKKLRLSQGMYVYQEVEGLDGGVFILKEPFSPYGNSSSEQDTTEKIANSPIPPNVTPAVDTDIKVGDRVWWPVEIHGGGSFIAEGIVSLLYMTRFAKGKGEVPSARIDVGDTYKKHFPNRNITTVMQSKLTLVEKGER